MTNAIPKVAVILNGDTETRHLNNVDMALTTLKDQGYTTFLVSVAPFESATDFAYLPNNTDQLLADLKGLGPSNAELVIYSTGHGSEEGICFDDCSNTVFEKLDAVPFTKRTVVMDQCFGGGLSQLFLDDPNTLFISAGIKGETDVCDDFAPYFWDPSVKDLNGNGTIDFQDRYINVVRQNQNLTTDQFLYSAGYVIGGKPSFSGEVVDITTEAEFTAHLKKIKPGQFLFLDLSASWCPPCVKFHDVYNEIAKKDKGQNLFIRTNNDALEETLSEKYGVDGIPAVLIIDHEGRFYQSSDIENCVEEIPYFHLRRNFPLQEMLSLISSPDKTEQLRGLTFLLNHWDDYPADKFYELSAALGSCLQKTSDIEILYSVHDLVFKMLDQTTKTAFEPLLVPAWELFNKAQEKITSRDFDEYNLALEKIGLALAIFSLNRDQLSALEVDELTMTYDSLRFYIVSSNDDWASDYATNTMFCDEAFIPILKKASGKVLTDILTSFIHQGSSVTERPDDRTYLGSVAGICKNRGLHRDLPELLRKEMNANLWSLQSPQKIMEGLDLLDGLVAVESLSDGFLTNEIIPLIATYLQYKDEKLIERTCRSLLNLVVFAPQDTAYAAKKELEKVPSSPTAYRYFLTASRNYHERFIKPLIENPMLQWQKRFYSE